VLTEHERRLSTALCSYPDFRSMLCEGKRATSVHTHTRHWTLVKSEVSPVSGSHSSPAVVRLPADTCNSKLPIYIPEVVPSSNLRRRRLLF